MTRMFAFIAALLLTALTVSSTCIATTGTPIQFTIEPAQRSGLVEVRFRRDRNGHSENNWSSSFRSAELAGLDMAALQGPVARPVRFNIAREAGRVDCAGSGAVGMARGTCTVVADPQFEALLRSYGIAQPSEEQTFGLISLNVRRSLVEALGAARYPAPSIDNLFALTAVGVTRDYIRGLAAAGYRPQSLDGLIQFAALKITPDYIGSFIRAGYSNLKPDELVQLKALNITPEYVASFDRLGYGRLPVDTLVQLKALDVTPEFVRAVAKGNTLPSPERLVQLRALGEEIHRN